MYWPGLVSVTASLSSGRTHQRNDDLAIRGGLEVVCLLQRLPDKTVVVDLAIDGEDNALVGIGKGLSSALCVFLLGDIFEAGDTGSRRTNADNAEPLMAKDCVVADNTAACGSANVSVFGFISCDSGGREGREGGGGGKRTPIGSPVPDAAR
jgi:hypothetical protein